MSHSHPISAAISIIVVAASGLISVGTLAAECTVKNCGMCNAPLNFCPGPCVGGTVESVAGQCDCTAYTKKTCCTGGGSHTCGHCAAGCGDPGDGSCIGSPGAGGRPGTVTACSCADPAQCDLPLDPFESPDDGKDDDDDGYIDDPDERPDPDGGTTSDGGGGGGDGGGVGDGGRDPDAGYNNNGSPPDPDNCEGSGPNSVAYAQGNAFIRPVTDFRIGLWGGEYFEFARGYDSNSGWHSNLPKLVIENDDGQRAVFTRADGRKVFFYAASSAWTAWFSSNHEFANTYRMGRIDTAYAGCPFGKNVDADFEIRDEKYAYRYHLYSSPSVDGDGVGNCGWPVLHPELETIVDLKTGNRAFTQEWRDIPGGREKITFAPDFPVLSKFVCRDTFTEPSGLFATAFYGPFDPTSDPDACGLLDSGDRRRRIIVKYATVAQSGGGSYNEWRIDGVVHYDSQGNEASYEAFQYKYEDRGAKFLKTYFKGPETGRILVEAFDYYADNEKPSQRNKVMWHLSDKESTSITYNDENTEATLCQAGDPSVCKKVTYGYNRLVTGKTGAGSCSTCGQNELVNAEWSGFQPRWKSYRNKMGIANDFAGVTKWTWHPPTEVRTIDQNDPGQVLKTRLWYGVPDVEQSGFAWLTLAPLTIAERVLDEGRGDTVLKTTVYDYTEDASCLGLTTEFLRTRVSSEPISLPAAGETLPSCTPASSRVRRVIVEAFDPVDSTYRTRVKELSYSGEGLPVREVGFAGEVTEYQYTNGRLSEKKRLGPSGVWFSTKYENFDAFGNPGQVTGEDLVVTTFEYDPQGRVIAENRADGSTVFRYGPHGFLERQMTLYSQGVGLTQNSSSTRFIYGTYGRVERIDYENRSLQLFPHRETFTTLHSVTQTFNDTGNVTRREYKDAAGIVKKIEVYTYDASGTLTGVKNTNVEGRDVYKIIQTAFDVPCHDALLTRVGKRETITDELGRAEFKCYDAFDRLVAVVARDGGISRYEYTPQGNLQSVWDTLGHKTDYVYDGFGQLRRVYSPDGGLATYVYDPAGRLTEKTDAKGTIRYCYDVAGKLTSVRTGTCDVPDVGVLVRYLYEDMVNGQKTGRLSEIQDQSGTTTISYDAGGNVVAEMRSFPWMADIQLKTQYEYDRARQVTAITYPSEAGGQRYQIDRTAFGRVTALNGGQVGVTGIAYEPFGALSGFTFGNGVGTNLEHYAGGATRKIHVETAANYVLLDKTFSYDDTGRINSITGQEAQVQANQFNGRLAYAYDPAGRLESAESIDQLGSYGESLWLEGFTYDTNGRRLTKSTTGANVQAKSETYEYYSDNNRLRTVNDPLLGAGANFDTTIWTLRAGLNSEFAALLDECKKAGSDLTSKKPAIMLCEEAIRDKFVELLRKYSIDVEMFKTVVMSGRQINGSAFKMVQSKNSYLAAKGKSLLDSTVFALYMDELKKTDLAAEIQTLEQVKYAVAAETGPNTHYLYDAAGNTYAEIVVCEGSNTCGVLCYDHDVQGRLTDIYVEGRTVEAGKLQFPNICDDQPGLPNYICLYVQRDICSSEADRSRVAHNAYDYKNRRVASTDTTLLLPMPNKYFAYDLADNLISEVFYGPKDDDEDNNFVTSLKEYVYLNRMPVAQVVYGEARTFTAGGCQPGGGCQPSGCTMMGDERAERENLLVFLVLLPLFGVAVVGVRRGKLKRWHAAGLVVVAVIFLMAPYKAVTFTRGVAFYYHVDHLNTPIKMTSEGGSVVWDVTQKHPFGDFVVKAATNVNMSDYTGNSADNRNYTVENPLRFPGQYNDYNYRSLITENGVGPYYNWHRWYSPQTGRYIEIDPVMFTRAFYNYGEENPALLVDPCGLTVLRCCRDVQVNYVFNGIARVFNLQHCFIKTDTTEAGMGPGGGGAMGSSPFYGSTKITDHSGQSNQAGTSCVAIEDVNEGCVNDSIQVGANTGRWSPWNNCNTLTDDIFKKCRK